MSDTLKNAYQLYTKKKYSEVINLLEPQVFRFRGEFNFFYLLGMSCLYQGDYGGAFSYLRRAISIKEDDINTLLGIAVVYLKRGETADALRLWLDIIELEPNNTYALRGLNFLKKNSDVDSFVLAEKLIKFIPQEKRKRKIPKLFIIITVVLIGGLVLFVLPKKDTIFQTVENLFQGRNKRPEISIIELDTRKDYLNLKGEYTYILTEKEVEKKFKLIQDYLYKFKDNLAQHEINFLLSSNASEYVKDRARLLEKYIKEPELATFNADFSYKEVIQNPPVYNNCFILWKGKATNLEQTEEVIKFDFLVGYQENIVLEGIIPVSFNFPIRVIIDQPIELLAKITFNEEKELSLEGISIKYLKPTPK